MSAWVASASRRLRPRPLAHQVKALDALVEGVAVTLGIGAAASRPDAEEELDATLQRADVTLYPVKRAGGN
jgi:GGDEF domain-containing protein